jgi:hypothetical protein
LLAGTATAGTAPLKLTSGTNLTTPEAGAVEFDGTHFYGTVGTTRYQLDQQSGITLTTTGSSGAATLVGSTLNIPVYTGGGGGISRTITSISTATTAGATASTDYVYFVSGTTTLTLPTAVSNTNRYTVKNTGTATVTIATTSSQTITVANNTAVTTITLPPGSSFDLLSDNANWQAV